MPKKIKNTFWENLKFPVQKRHKQLKNLNLDTRIRRLKKDFGITDTAIKKLTNKLNGIKSNANKIHFLYFEKFFRVHNNAIRLYFDTSLNQALIKLIRAFPKDKSKFMDIHYYNLWLKMGRGFNYGIEITREQFNSIAKLKKGRLSPSHAGAWLSYKEEAKCPFEGLLLIVLRRGTTKNYKLKFIALAYKEKKLYFSPNFSSRERFRVLKKIAKHGIIINLLPRQSAFEKLTSFIKGEGDSSQQALDLFGVTFLKGNSRFQIRQNNKVRPDEDILAVIKNSLPEEFNITHLKEIQLYNSKKTGRDKIDRYTINRFRGIIYFNLNSAGFNNDDYNISIDSFDSQFDINPEYPYVDPYFDKKSWYNYFLDNASGLKLPGIEIFPDALHVHNELKSMKLLAESQKAIFGWMCFETNCIKYGLIIGSPRRLKCTGCRNLLFKIKDDISYTKDSKQVLNFVYDKAVREGFIPLKIKKMVFNKAFNLLKIMNNNRDELTLAVVYQSRDIKYIRELCKRCTNMILIGAGGNIEILNEPVYKVKLGDFVYNYLFGNRKIMNEGFIDQASQWDTKKINRASDANTNLEKIHKSNTQKNIKKYTYLDYEVDCFSLIRYLFTNSIWLGVSESGKKLPDGIAVLLNNSCFMWDCKLSFAKDGALVGSYNKNREYLKVIGDNKIINKLGGLKTYIIISNNPDKEFFRSVFERIKKYSRGKFRAVNYSLLNSRQLVKIYQFIREKMRDIEGNISVRDKFYFKLAEFICKEGVNIIGDAEVDGLVSELQNILSTVDSMPRLDKDIKIKT